jgi:exodeoxyribonuclease VII large subunit
VAQALAVCNQALTGLDLLVEGEVSSYNVSQGKWVFFDLKDTSGEAKVRCFTTLYQLSLPLEDGMRIVMKARPTIHAKTGNFSLIPSQIELKGEGSLKRAFELLTKKLDAEGLFSLDRKREIPAIPSHVGILSSEGAAGFGDFMQIAKDRLPGVKYTLVNVAVQGMRAEEELIRGLDYLNSYIHPEVIVMIRGGGSLEDLQAFNSEKVARAIARSKVPVVVGVGHERDVTIADYVADVRASTPSNAAERVIPSREAIKLMVTSYVSQVSSLTSRHLTTLKHVTLLRLSAGNQRISRYLQQIRDDVVRQCLHAHQLLTAQVVLTRQITTSLTATIDALAPSRVLARGYSVTMYDGKVLRSVSQAPPGSKLTTHLSDGYLTSTVTK